MKDRTKIKTSGFAGDVSLAFELKSYVYKLT